MNKLFPDILNKKGVKYLKDKRFSEAIMCFKKAISMNGKYTEAYVNLGITYSDAGLTEEAVKAFTKASVLDPLYMDKYGIDLNQRKDPEEKLLVMEAKNFYSKGNFKKAADLVEEALRLKPNYPDFRCFAGEIYMKLNRLEKARYHLEKGLEINPSFEKAKENLSTVLYLKGLEYFGDGMTAEMLTIWRKALKVYPKNDFLRLNVNIEFAKAVFEAKCENCEKFSATDYKYCPFCGLEK